MLPCTSPIPPPFGTPNLELLIPVTAAPPALPPSPPLPAYAEPRNVNDFPLSRTPVQYWLATLARATYAPTGTLFTRAAQAVLPSSYPVTFTPNSGGAVPGYGVLKMPQGAIVVVSGTTSLGQWISQIFSSALQPLGDYGWGLLKPGTQAIYNVAAHAIYTALGPLVPNDQQILFVGHSMGGAVAQVLHALTSTEDAPRVPSRCVTFGSPKPGDSRLSNTMRNGAQVHRRFLLEGDFIPALPPNLGLLRAAAPAAFQAVSGSWDNYRQPAVPYYVRASGSLDVQAEPFLPLLMIGAMVAASVGLPIEAPALHLMRRMTERLEAAMPGGIPDSQSEGWTDPNDLKAVNAALTQSGL